MCFNDNTQLQKQLTILQKSCKNKNNPKKIKQIYINQHYYKQKYLIIYPNSKNYNTHPSMEKYECTEKKIHDIIGQINTILLCYRLLDLSKVGGRVMLHTF